MSISQNKLNDQNEMTSTDQMSTTEENTTKTGQIDLNPAVAILSREVVLIKLLHYVRLEMIFEVEHCLD